MWAIDDIEFKEYLAYSLICGYFTFNDKSYGRLEYELGCVGVYALCYNFKLEFAYH